MKRVAFIIFTAICVFVGYFKITDHKFSVDFNELEKVCTDRTTSQSVEDCYKLEDRFKQVTLNPVLKIYYSTYCENMGKKCKYLLYTNYDFDKKLKLSKYGCYYNSPISCVFAFRKLREPSLKEEYATKACNISIDNCLIVGNEYYQSKQLKIAQKYYKKACENNDPIGCFNQACLASIDKNFIDTGIYLEKALKHGFSDKESLLNDPDLQNYRKHIGVTVYKSKFIRN